MKKKRLILLAALVVLSFCITYDKSYTTEEQCIFSTGLKQAPGWSSDLAIFKYREEASTPANLSLYYRKMDKARQLEFRGEQQLEHEVELGPSNISGRTRAYLIDAMDPNHHFAGSVSGGLWESWDAGKSWSPQSDHEENMSVTYIAQNPFNPDIIYYSTGEVAGNSANISGVGVFKSEDRGKSFQLLPGSRQNGLFATWRVVCSPSDAQTIYVTSRKGAYVSKDGGESFEQFYFEECPDIEILKDGTVFLAVIGRGIYRGKESDLTHWERLKLPNLGAAYRRIEMAISPSNPEVMYAAFAKASDQSLLAIIRSKDGGDTWLKRANPDVYTSQSWYNLVLQVHPEEPNIVVFGNVQMAVSYLGGFSWFRMRGSHSDRHLAYFDPHDPDHMIMTSDGGIDEYRFENKKMKFVGNLKNSYNVTQYYAGDYFPDSNKVIGGAQDNGTTAGTDNSRVFNKIYGADGTFCAVAKDDPNKVLWGTQNGNIYLTRSYNKKRRSSFSIVNYFKDGLGGNNYFIAPFYLNSKYSEQLLFFKRNSIWFTENLGKTWVPVDESFKQPYCGVFLEAAQTAHVIIGGSKIALKRYTYDRVSKEFINKTELNALAPKEIKNAFIRGMVLDPVDSNALYVCFSTVSKQPRVWRIEGILGDQPQWVNVSGDLPPYLPVNDIAISQINPKELAAATDYGVYTTMDGGVHWVRNRVIPNVAVFQVKIRATDNKLFAFTHGRGAWMADFPQFPVNVKRPYKEGVLRIFPNPVRDRLTFVLERDAANFGLIGWYEIVNLEGKVLKSGRVGNNSRSIQLGDLSPGLYWLRLRTPGKSSFIKQIVKL